MEETRPVIATADILTFLECPPRPPGIHSLNRLVRAYVRKVPWETASRIVKRAQTPDITRRPRWPDEFWQAALHSGAGGTCFESNYAFFALLQSLRYTGYLTVNDMGERRGCHSAIVIHLDGRKYLVDVGIPLLTSLPIHPRLATRRSTWLHTYTLQPDDPDRYQVLRSRHPSPNIYTLLDRPVGEPDYRRVVEQDYGENGLFLDRLILVKIIAERLWRFNSLERPYHLEWFAKEDRGDIPLPAGRAPGILAERFHLAEETIRAAFKILDR